VASNKLEATLREGIEAARRGDKLAARRLLQQVLQQDRGNETALMWMASVVDTLPERRAYLEQVLRINPANDRAREALERLGGTAPSRAAAPPPKSASSAAPKPAPAPRRASRGINPYFLAAAAIAAVMLLVIVVFLLTQSGAPPQAEVVIVPTSTAQAGSLTTARPTTTRTPVPPTALPVVIVTLDRTQSSLPPTFTPTPSPEPTATLTPSPTPLPLSSYPIVFAAVPPQDFLPSLFTGQADGAGIEEVGDEDGYFDIALSPDGATIAFVRDIAPADSAERDWQLFTAPVSDPTNLNRITNIESAGIEHPAWSSDGRSIVYAANVDGDYDLFRVPANPDGSAEPVALTDNDAYDSYPAFPPDGDTLLFVSDRDTPGFTRMFRLTAEGVLSPFSNVTGSVTSPVYSPDGARVAYVQRQSGDPDIFIIGADGQRPFQLTIDDTADDRSPAWSRDGRWIAFASNRNGNRFLWYFVNTGTSAVVPLNDLAEAQSIAFLPEQGV
jgi:hypothetical protein